MLLGLTAEAWGSIGTVAGVVGMTGASIIAWGSNATKRAHDLELESVNKAIEHLDASQKASWVHVDDLRINAVRRQDQDKLREEFRNDIRTLGDRLEQAITALRNDIHRGGN